LSGYTSLTALAGTGTGANAGTIIVGETSKFIVGGTVKNSGTISLVGGGEATLGIERDTILEGGGQINLSTGQFADSSQISDLGLGHTLTNVDNVISGSGTVSVALVNETKGVIDANGSNLQVGGSGYPVTNAGVLEATSTGYLVLQGPVTNTASGVIGAFGGDVILEGGGLNQPSAVPGGGPASVSGGTLETGSAGEIFLYGYVTLDGSNGHTVTNTGSVSGYSTANTNLTLLGTINNTGTIALTDSSGQTITVGTGGVTLAGNGSITLPDTTANEIFGSGTSTTLTNQNTIFGAGTIGGNGLLLTNQGVIDATGTNPLIVDTGASAVTNSGTLEATGNSTLFVASNVNNTGHLIAANRHRDFCRRGERDRHSHSSRRRLNRIWLYHDFQHHIRSRG
jgi:hypothetical protein